MKMKWILIIVAAVVVVAMMSKKKSSTIATPGGVAKGGQQSWSQIAAANVWGIADKQLGNIFGGGDSGPSPAGSTQASNDQLLQGELGSLFGG
jgi:hypothetical protein